MLPSTPPSFRQAPASQPQDEQSEVVLGLFSIFPGGVWVPPSWEACALGWAKPLKW